MTIDNPTTRQRIDDIVTVLVNPNTGRLVLVGKPTAFHNCDRRGCGSVEHKIAEFNVDSELFYQESEDRNND